MKNDKEDEAMEGSPKEYETIKGNANEDELQQIPTKRMCYTVKTSSTVHATNATHSKYGRIKSSCLNATACKLLVKFEHVKCNSQSKIQSKY